VRFTRVACAPPRRSSTLGSILLATGNNGATYNVDALNSSSFMFSGIMLPKTWVSLLFVVSVFVRLSLGVSRRNNDRQFRDSRRDLMRLLLSCSFCHLIDSRLRFPRFIPRIATKLQNLIRSIRRRRDSKDENYAIEQVSDVMEKRNAERTEKTERKRERWGRLSNQTQIPAASISVTASAPRFSVCTAFARARAWLINV